MVFKIIAMSRPVGSWYNLKTRVQQSKLSTPSSLCNGRVQSKCIGVCIAGASWKFKPPLYLSGLTTITCHSADTNTDRQSKQTVTKERVSNICPSNLSSTCLYCMQVNFWLLQVLEKGSMTPQWEAKVRDLKFHSFKDADIEGYEDMQDLDKLMAEHTNEYLHEPDLVWVL